MQFLAVKNFERFQHYKDRNPPWIKLHAAVLDDYEGNVVFGYNIVMETNRYAARYAGNGLSCTSCHLKGGTQPDGFPLNVAGVYPKWRSKNGVRNGIGLRIRDCFLYSLNGIMPPEESAEVQAVAAYINYLSEGEVIGRPPKGWGVPTLPDTGADPNPPRGQVVYKRECAVCHGAAGRGDGPLAARLSDPHANLRKPTFHALSAGPGAEPEEQALARIIRHGLPPTSMPGHEWLTGQQVADLVAFVRTLPARRSR